MHLKEDQLLDYIKQAREEYALKHFKKHETELNLDEMKELDMEHPGWTLVFTKKSYPVEVSIGGTRVRDYKTKKEFKIIYSGQHSARKGYPFIVVGNGDRIHMESVHYLVAKAFVDNPDTKPEINHKDGNKWNNCYLNLEWVTRSENIQHAVRTGLNVALKGEEAGRANCTADQVRNVCDLLIQHSDWPFEKISAATGVSPASVKGINQRKIWLDVVNEYGPFPKREASPRGEGVGNSVYTEEQIHQVCKLLQNNPDMKYDMIESITGVKKSMISAIYHRDNWVHISQYYTFPQRQTQLRGENGTGAKYTEVQAEQICCMLDDVHLGKSKMSHKQIADAVGVTKNMVKDINRGKAWASVSKKHDFYKAKFGDK